MKIVKWGLAAVVAVLLAAGVFLYAFPPDLIRVGANYSAKIVCSNHFLADREPDQVLEVDVQAPGHPILSFMSVSVDDVEQSVRAGLFGMIGDGLAVYRDGFGCTSVPDGKLSALQPLPNTQPAGTHDEKLPWPQGNADADNTLAELSAILGNEELTGPGLRALVIVKDGKIVAETYGENITKDTPLLGWSMAKTVTAALIGRLAQQNRIDLEADNLFPLWRNDKRSEIQLTDLMGMASDLDWNEGYGTVSDVTRMLYLEPDMAAPAIKPKLRQRDGSKIGQRFDYSSGTTVALSRYWQDLFSSADDALLFPAKHLFRPLGMSSAVMETDARGTFVGGSYMYATARDWARFGQFILQKGKWNGEQLLPDGFVDWMTTPHPANEKGDYGNGQIWLRPPGADREGDNPIFNHTAYWMAGHDGQSIAILPEENLVIVRLGLTPSRLQYKAAKLANAVVEVLK